MVLSHTWLVNQRPFVVKPCLLQIDEIKLVEQEFGWCIHETRLFSILPLAICLNVLYFIYTIKLNRMVINVTKMKRLVSTSLVMMITTVYVLRILIPVKLNKSLQNKELKCAIQIIQNSTLLIQLNQKVRYSRISEESNDFGKFYCDNSIVDNTLCGATIINVNRWLQYWKSRKIRVVGQIQIMHPPCK